MTEMNRYANGKIYMIESASAGLCYYGSTCLPLHKRLHGHRNHFKCYQNGKSTFLTSFRILDYEDHKIILVEEYPCETKQQLVAREAYFIRNNECVNKNISFLTPLENKERRNARGKQHYEHNKELIAEKRKIIYHENKEAISERRKEKKVCECGSMCNIGGVARHERTSKHTEFIKNKSISDSH